MINVRGRGAGAIEAEVPSSITQFDASTIEALGAQDISDLSRVTPNVNIVQPGATQATFFVRGVGLSDFSSNAAGAVTIFQDDVALNAPAIQTGQLYDVEGIDVVRGPQGSGPFRNASAGAIRVRSRRPTGNYGAQLRSSIGRYDTEGRQGREERADPGLRGRARGADRRGVALLALRVPPARGGPVPDQWLRLRAPVRPAARLADRNRSRSIGSTTPGVSQCGERDASRPFRPAKYPRFRSVSRRP